MLSEETKTHLINYSEKVPEGMRGRKATEEDIQKFEKDFYPIPDDYKWILKNCYRVFFKAEWIDDIDELYETHKKFKKESSIENGWTLEGTFIMGWDGCGNPYGIELKTEKIVTEDHNFGGIHIIGQSLEEVLSPNHKKDNS